MDVSVCLFVNIHHVGPVFYDLISSFLYASVLMQRLSYPTETVLSNKITMNRIVLSLKDSPR